MSISIIQCNCWITLTLRFWMIFYFLQENVDHRERKMTPVWRLGDLFPPLFKKLETCILELEGSKEEITWRILRLQIFNWSYSFYAANYWEKSNYLYLRLILRSLIKKCKCIFLQIDYANINSESAVSSVS